MERPTVAALRVSYLSSYSGMGQLGIQCAGGCHCKGVEIDAHRGASRSARYISVAQSTDLPLEIRSARCFLQLQVLNRSSSGGFKFKLLEVTLHLSGTRGGRDKGQGEDPAPARTGVDYDAGDSRYEDASCRHQFTRL